MENDLFSKYASAICSMSEAEPAAEIKRPQRLLLDSAIVRGKRIEVAYAPFDHVNLAADIVIVGVTPGRQQMGNALVEARRALKSGSSESEAMSAAKIFASFSGQMRTNLIAMLDSIGVNRLLGIESAKSLWKGDARRVHFTSALRYPVLVDSSDYSGAPSMLSTPLLREHLTKWFAGEMAALPNAVFVPLGPKVAEAVEMIARQLGLAREQVLAGLPHPSGANG